MATLKHKVQSLEQELESKTDKLEESREMRKKLERELEKLRLKLNTFGRSGDVIGDTMREGQENPVRDASAQKPSSGTSAGDDQVQRDVQKSPEKPSAKALELFVEKLELVSEEAKAMSEVTLCVVDDAVDESVEPCASLTFPVKAGQATPLFRGGLPARVSAISSSRIALARKRTPDKSNSKNSAPEAEGEELVGFDLYEGNKDESFLGTDVTLSLLVATSAVGHSHRLVLFDDNEQKGAVVTIRTKERTEDSEVTKVPVKPKSSSLADGEGSKIDESQEDEDDSLRVSEETPSVVNGIAEDAPPLLRSAFDGDVSRVRSILKSDPDAILDNDLYLNGPLHAACFSETDAQSVVEELLKAGAKPYEANDADDLPVHIAAKSKHRKCLASLVASLDNPSNVNALDGKQRSPLHLTVINGDLPSTQLLCDAQAEPNLADNEGKFPLDYAQQGSSLYALLVSVGAKHSERWTTIGASKEVKGSPAEKENTRWIDSDDEELPEDGDSAEAVEPGSPHFIAENSDEELEESQERERAKKEIQPEDEVMLDFLSAVHEGDVSHVQQALSTSSRDAKHIRKRLNLPLSGYYVLHYAAHSGSVDIIDLLLRHGAHPNVTTVTESDTPLIRAALAGHEGVVRSLMRAGADPTIRDGHGYTALHRAVEYDYDGVVRALLLQPTRTSVSQGHEESYPVPMDPNLPLDPSADGGRGDTALHMAARDGMKAMVEALLECGADPSALNAEGKSPFEVAKKKRIRKLLLHAE